ncbi:tetratricopeptide repeat protein [Citreimonas salinaria]|uniref:tetratricopeptide repeat protein n=1 Tax=Citreimonas salinaria TaxID=321339 RepID=UPI00115FA0E1|nr:hypothetical protein [Citreimonas salinaria]
MGSGYPVAALAVVLAVAAVMLVPSRSDQAWFLMRDVNPMAALSAAEAARAEAPSDERAARVLALIQMHLGDMDAAGSTLRERVEISGGAPGAIHELARHHVSMGRPREAIELFLTLPAISLSPDEQLYVAGWLRANRDVAGELGFLSELWREGGLDSAGAHRYAALLAASGDRSTSVSVYRTLDGNGALLDPVARLQFQTLLQQAGHTEEAARRVAEWR